MEPCAVLLDEEITMNRRYCLVLALLLTTSAALAASKPAPFRWDWNDVPASLQRLQASKDPAARRIRAQILNGHASLAKERKIARAWGLPLTTAEWPVRPPASGEDARPLYDRARALEEKDGLEWSEQADEFLAQAQQGKALAPADLEALRADIAKYRQVLNLVHQGAAKPYLSLPAPKSMLLGGIPFGADMSRQREVLKYLDTEAQVLALDGRFTEAARILALGYNVARQTYREPTLIPYLVGTTIESMAHSGLEFILHQAGPDEKVARVVLAALEQAPGGPLLPWAFRGEAWYNADLFQLARQSGPYAFTANLVEAPPSKRPRQLTASERVLYYGLVDAMEADALRRLRGLIVAAGKPYGEGNTDMDRLVPNALDPQDPVSAWAVFSLQTMSQVGANEARRLARQQVLRAGASVLAYRDRTGSWPDRLDDALVPPTDPFTGRPMGYRVEGDGFVVWSAGETQAFDGGTPGPKPRCETLFRFPRCPA